jgi:two-component system chemotaxis response regulator CheY
MQTAGPRVLVIDDDYDLREEIVDLLLEAGFDAVSAKDGRDGLLEARLHDPIDVIVLDLHMPMLDGGDFRDVQRSDPRLARIPVVLVSADRDAREAAARIEATAVVAKPFAPATLIDAVRGCCMVREGAAE